MKKSIKITIFVILVLTAFSIWVPFAGMYMSGVGSSAYMVEEYIEAKSCYPKNLRELEDFHDFTVTNVEFNFDVPMDKITANGQKLYLNNKRVWLVKPKGVVCCLVIGFLIPSITTHYSYEIYKCYIENCAEDQFPAITPIN